MIASTGPQHTDRWVAAVALISMVRTAAKHEFVRKVEATGGEGHVSVRAVE